MAEKRVAVIALSLLVVVGAAAIVFLMWRVPDGSETLSQGAASEASTGGISVVAGGIGWPELIIIVFGLLTVIFGLAAFVALLVRMREGPK